MFELIAPKTTGGEWKEKVLYSFRSAKDGANPNGGLIFGSKGAIYGTTSWGGGSSNCTATGYAGCGTVYKLTPPTTKGDSWVEKILHSFSRGADGASPNGGLIFDANGSLYGTAALGGKGMVWSFAFYPQREGLGRGQKARCTVSLVLTEPSRWLG